MAPVTTLFVYGSTGYEVAALTAVAIFGILLERRHGWWAPLAVFLIGGALGMLLVVGVDELSVATGGNGAALALLAAWAMRDVLGRRKGREDDADLLGRAGDRLAARPAAGGDARTRTRSPGSAAASPASSWASAWRACASGAARRAYSDADVEAAIQALSDPARLEEAQRMVGANAPGIQRILNEALQAADWFGSAHQAAVLEAAGKPDVDERLTAVRTLSPRRRTSSMLIGVAVGYELAHELMRTED